MPSNPLSGTVSKTVLLVRPGYAQEKEFLHFLKFKLYDAGFIVCREEYRRINAELANELCFQFDDIPDYLKGCNLAAAAAGDGASASAGEAASCVIPDSMLPTPSDMVGQAYVYVLAHSNCHAALQRFIVEKLFTEKGDDVAAEANGAEDGDSVSYNELVTAIARARQDSESFRGASSPHSETDGSNEQLPPPPAIFVNKSADGARKAIHLLFPRMLAADVPTATQSREYVQANLKTALLPALTQLSKEKPADPLRWLADQLLMNNPASPPLVSQGHS